MSFSLTGLFKNIKKTTVAPIDRVVGIDFGSSSIKVVELEKKDSFVALKTYGELQLGPYGEQALGAYAELLPEQQTQALVDVMRESGVAGQAGVLALPLNDSFVTIIKINARADEDITPRIKVEARKYIPIPLNEVSLEWTELLPYKDQPKTEREVLVAAVQNEAYQQTNTLLQSVGLASQPTEIEMFCSQRALTTEATTTTMIIDFGALTCKSYIVKDGMIRKLHRVFSGGVKLTQLLAQQTNVSFEIAENAKRHNGAAGITADQVKAATEEVFTRALQEFKRVLVQFETDHSILVGDIVVTGSSVANPHLLGLTTTILDRKPTVANPFEKIAYPAFMEDTLKDIAPTFGVALGAALRSFT